MKTFLLFFCFSFALWSNPIDPIVIDGKAEFSNPAKHILHINAQDQTLLHWKDFSIEAHEITQFLQPSKHALVLNKVTGNHLSSILGKLEANGQVMLVNPNGILFGEGAYVETGNFIASTLDVFNEDLNGALLFKGDSKAGIINHGTIKALNGDVTLISRLIENHGMIHTPHGQTRMGCGREVLLKTEGDERIYIRAHPSDIEEEIGIHNLGTISAIQAELKADGNPYSYAIKHEGEIDALGVTEKEGRVLLIAEEGKTVVSGTITAKNANGTGGTVHLLGKQVALIEDAMIDISGELGGGTLLAGGSFQGSDPNILNSEITFVEKDVSVLGRAIMKGDGGEAIFWSDGNTYFYGSADVRGGEQAGDGGLVEVSGALGFDFKGTTNRLAPNGEDGTLLLDPTSNVTINNGGGTAAGSFIGGTWIPTAAVSTIDIAQLFPELGLGNVIIQTNYGAGPFVGGSITLDTSLTTPAAIYTTATSLSFQTLGNMTVNGTLKNNGTGDMFFNIGGNFTVQGTAGATPALIGTHDGLMQFTNVGGNYQVLGGPDNSSAQVGHDDDIATGNIQVDSVGGNVLIQGSAVGANAFAHVGHGAEGDAPLAITGNITFSNVAGNFSVLGGGAGANANAFAHVGHATKGSSNGTISGNISINCDGAVQVLAGSSTDCFAQIGHGGLINNTAVAVYSGDILINAGGPVAVAGGQTAGFANTQTFGVIGFAQEAVTGTNFISNSITINTPSSVTVTAGSRSDAVIGALFSPFLGPFTGPQSAALNAVNVNAGGDINLLGFGGAFVTPSEAIIGVTRDYAGDPIRSLFANLNLNAGGEINLIGGANPGFFGTPGSSAILRSATSRFAVLPPANIIATAQQNFNLISDGGSAGIFCSNVLDARSINANFNMTPGFGAIAFITTFGPATVRAGVDMNLNPGGGTFFSTINTNGNSLSLVVDDLFPVVPLIGPGRYFQAADATVSTASPTGTFGPLRIFTSRQPLNSILGTLNGFGFVPGPEHVDTLQERWGIYFFDPFNGNPFTVFYKDSSLILIASAQAGLVATAELFRDLHPYDEFTKWSIRFENHYDKKKYNTLTHPTDSLSSFDILDDTFNFIRRQNRRDTAYLYTSPFEYF